MQGAISPFTTKEFLFEYSFMGFSLHSAILTCALVVGAIIGTLSTHSFVTANETKEDPDFVSKMW